MSRHFKKILLSLCVLLYGTGHLYGCTTVMFSDNNMAIAGSNEDSFIILTILWFVPAKEGNYSRVCLGYEINGNSLQGGFNEKGLFIDGSALGPKNWKPDPLKLNFEGSLLDTILAKCATIKEVRDFFEKYNVKALNDARFPVMDRTGESMVIEWFNEEVTFLKSDKPYQVATNFVGSRYNDLNAPCWRYRNAMNVLSKNSKASIETVKEALVSSYQNDDHIKTVYSYICDLNKGEIYIYNWHNFDEVVKFNLSEEVQTGYSEYYLYNLFKPDSEYMNFIQNGVYESVNYGYRENNTAVALWFYDACKDKYPVIFKIRIKPEDLYKLANQLVSENILNDALVFLKRNIQEFPDHTESLVAIARIYESLNESFKSLKYYAEALDLDRNNSELLAEFKNLSDKIFKIPF